MGPPRSGHRLRPQHEGIGTLPAVIHAQGQQTRVWTRPALLQPHRAGGVPEGRHQAGTHTHTLVLVLEDVAVEDLLAGKLVRLQAHADGVVG